MVGTRLLLMLGMVAGCTVPDPGYLGEEADTGSGESQAEDSSADDESSADSSSGSDSGSDSSSTGSSTTDADTGPETSGDEETDSGDGDADSGDGDGDSGDGDGDSGDGDGDGDAFEYTSRDCEGADTSVEMSDVQSIFNLHCIECHSGPQAPHDQDLTPGLAWASIVNVTAGNCSKIRVIPGEPAASYILDKLEDLDLCGGTQMPKNEAPLSLDDRNTIQNWICAGAPE